MAKSKNHTTHNQSAKNHRNGIKKPKPQRFRSLQGVDPVFLRNQRWARKVPARVSFGGLGMSVDAMAALRGVFVNRRGQFSVAHTLFLPLVFFFFPSPLAAQQEA